ncbi:MAG: Gfo/Idh/MocA family oxidoreductase [Clostridia bacterium]|nr:Gfo/Idh/MocA family oxidoreductase [Clostridia bacterium]
MKKIKIAQIGIAHDHATGAYASFKALSHMFDVVGYCTVEGDEFYPERLHTDCFPDNERMTLEEILNNSEIEAVVIETEEEKLVKYATLALQAGKHVQMDKPGGEDADEFENMMRIAKEKNLVVHLGYMYRYNSFVQKLMQDIKEGKYGEIYAVEAHMDCLHTKEKRDWLKRFQGGMMHFLGCHLVDLILSIQGLPDEIIPLNCATGFDGVTANDYGMAVFKYKNGVSFAKTCAAEPGGFMRRQLIVCGEKGTVELKPLEWFVRYPEGRCDQSTTASVMMKKDAEQHGWGLTWDKLDKTPASRYDAMMEAFGRMIWGEIENPYTYAYEVQLHRVVLAACGFDIDYKKEIIL